MPLKILFLIWWMFHIIIGDISKKFVYIWKVVHVHDKFEWNSSLFIFWQCHHDFKKKAFSWKRFKWFQFFGDSVIKSQYGEIVHCKKLINSNCCELQSWLMIISIQIILDFLGFGYKCELSIKKSSIVLLSQWVEF